MSFRPKSHVCAIMGCLLTGIFGSPLHAASNGKNPASKFFVSDLAGESQVTISGKILPLEKKSVFSAQGSVIETKVNATNSLVYSNGTGIFLGESSRLELRRFVQEPFTPNRVDLETEPSISQTQAFLARGTVGLCTSRLVAGSSMVYQTPLASVTVLGRKVVIEAGEDVTKISVLEGDCTVRAGNRDLGGQNVHAGEQAVIRRGAQGQPNSIEVAKIPPAELDQLEQSSSLACLSRQTVYFDVRERAAGSPNSAFEGVDGDRTSLLETTPGATPTNSTTPNLPTRLEIVPVDIIPGNLPVDFTVSPSRI